MRIVLVQCPAWPMDAPPLGLATVQAWLKTLGHQVDAVDFNLHLAQSNPEAYREVESLNRRSDQALELLRFLAADNPQQQGRDPWSLWAGTSDLQRNLNDMVQWILDRSPQAVGFSTQRESLVVSVAMAGMIRDRAEGIKLLFGGPECGYHRAYMQSLVDKGLIDAVVVGEGEEAIRFLLGTGSDPGVMSGPDYTPGVFSFKDFPVPDVDQLPAPDFTGLAPSLYSQSMIPLMASRGCVGRCSFCRERELWHRFRQRSADRVVTDMEDLSRRWGGERFRFNDSLVNGRPGWLDDFCSEAADWRLGVRWVANARPNADMTPELFQRLKESGCVELMFGMESASPPVLARLNKGMDPKAAARNLKDCHAAGIRAHTYWMLGCPGEGASDVARSLRFIGENIEHIDSLYFHRYFPSPDDLADPEAKRLYLRVNLPLFLPLFLLVRNLMSTPRDWDETGGEGDFLVHAKKLAQVHRGRRLAMALMAVTAAGLARLERTGWIIIRPHQSFLEQVDLKGQKAFLVLTGLGDKERDFISGLLQTGPRTIRLFALGEWSPPDLERLSELALACSENGIETQARSRDDAVSDPDDESPFPCEICLALGYATETELIACAEHLLNDLGLVTFRFGDVWNDRERIFDSFMARFCLARQGGRSSCVEPAPGDTAPVGVDDGWY